ncbi:MAG: DinB family protein [Dehalococcoidia bacterium]|nr:DinB family protein [Dehalococcoidia bacterium]
MNRAAFIRRHLLSLQESLDDAAAGLSQEQAHWRPDAGGNHIAFVLWHYSRTVDNIVRFVLQRKPTIWMEGKWDERFGLDSKSQGTGMSREDALAVSISDLPAFTSYMKEVWREAGGYLDTVSEGDLDRKQMVRPLGELTLEEILGTVLLTHGYTHLGEVWLLKGMQGLAGSPR